MSSLGCFEATDVECLWEKMWTAGRDKFAIQAVICQHVRSDGVYLQVRKVILPDNAEPRFCGTINVRDNEIEGFADAIAQARDEMLGGRGRR